MPQQQLYFDYVNGKLVPYLYVLTLDTCEIKWDKHVYYFNVIKPFEHEIFDFDNSQNSVSIFLSDLILNQSQPEQLGINLKNVKKRIGTYGVDQAIINQFILQVIDVNEVLALFPNQRKMSLLLS
ncbi:hypothetical protein [Cytobacillus sp. IB215665]|uniref:hypothetical protein n=1 Tax=Cytobacillus sp. IB215665 TaxID=3097357 RepID=UPI002A0F731E|nr:hypothetical protein [Cytobacillus sp. IB215665]MDX8366711.1 hypothetical protein [Cytobacillus sp. IB215665]